MGTNYLTLCEVEAYSLPDYTLPVIGSDNVAYNKYANQSSLYSEGEAFRAIDGNRS